METLKKIDLCQVDDNVSGEGHLQQLAVIGLLAGEIAHDFNNILNVISTAASLLLLKLQPDNPIRKELLLIECQSRSGSEITKQIVSLLRNDIVEDQTLDLNEIIEKSSGFFRQTKRNITIQRLFQTDLWAVNGQRQQIESVLLNLLINSAQAMPKGGEIRIETSNLEYIPDNEKISLKLNKGRYVEVSVSDTGTGMTRDVLESIFDPFFTTKASEGGCGLGLSSVVRIMEKHGGTITADSMPGIGSTFKLYLPAVNYN
jgi:signal transduction histidine kinase